MRRVYGLASSAARGRDQRAHPRRDGRRQGRDGARDPPHVAAREGAVRRAQLRGAVREPARERAVRAREGRVHRRDRRQGRACSRRRRAAPCSSTRSATCRAKLQAKLLRVIETREVQRVGSVKTRADRRALRRRDEPRPRGGDRGGAVPAATSIYRLNGITLHVPPLRERRGEILPLARSFLAQFAQRGGRRRRPTSRRRRRPARGLPVAGQRARAAQRRRARAAAVRGRRDPARAPAAREHGRELDLVRGAGAGGRAAAAGAGAAQARAPDGGAARPRPPAPSRRRRNASSACWPSAPATRRAPRRSSGSRAAR